MKNKDFIKFKKNICEISPDDIFEIYKTQLTEKQQIEIIVLLAKLTREEAKHNK
jgi:hypothetical protein